MFIKRPGYVRTDVKKDELANRYSSHVGQTTDHEKSSLCSSTVAVLSTVDHFGRQSRYLASQHKSINLEVLTYLSTVFNTSVWCVATSFEQMNLEATKPTALQEAEEEIH